MTRLSNRQYPLMKVFASEKLGFHMSVEDAKTFDQRPFRSALIQKWLAYKHGKGFYLTHEGRDAWREFNTTSIFRLHPEAPLTAYFDAKAYGLAPPRKQRRPPAKTALLAAPAAAA